QSVIPVVPSLTSVTPNGGQQGQVNLPVTITGQNTHFTNASVIDLGAAITVSNVAATDATHLTAQFTIARTAATGLRNLTVTTGTEVVTLPNAFKVVGPPVVTSVTPNTGQQGQTLATVAVVGQFTNFVNGTTVANFG